MQIKESANITSIPDFNQDEYDQGYNDALKAIQEIQRAIMNGQTMEGNGDSSNNGASADVGDNIGQNDVVDGSTLTPAMSDAEMQFGGNDLIDTDMAQEIAEEAGQPYDMEDIKNAQDVTKSAEDFVNKNREALEQIGEKSHGRGNMSMKSMLGTIDALFKPVVNWKAMLKHFLNTIGKKGVEPHYSRRMLGTTNPDLQDAKYIKYKDKPYYEKSGVAQVFHLIDGSGSMGGSNAPIFKQIFGEIVDMGKKAHIQKSAVAYFAAGNVDASQIRMWDEKATSKSVLTYLNRHENDNSGGTNVYRAIKSLEELGRPYFSTRKPNTLLIIYTDGEDDYSHIRDISPNILNNMVWVILNTSDQYIDQAAQEIENQGVKHSRILRINLNKIK